MADTYAGCHNPCDTYAQQDYYVKPNVYYGQRNAAAFNYVAPVSMLRSCCYDNYGCRDNAASCCSNVMSCWWQW